MANGNLDLRLDLSMPEHIKTARLCDRVGDAGFAALIRLWCYVGKHHRSGVLEGLSPAEIEKVSRYCGEPGTFHAALVEIGWLEEDGVTVHDWEQEQEHLFGRDDYIEACRQAGRAGGLKSGEVRAPKATKKRGASTGGLNGGVQANGTKPPVQGGAEAPTYLPKKVGGDAGALGAPGGTPNPDPPPWADDPHYMRTLKDTPKTRAEFVEWKAGRAPKVWP